MHVGYCPPWHRPVARSLALWRHGAWRAWLVRWAYPALARSLDAALAALPPEIER